MKPPSNLFYSLIIISFLSVIINMDLCNAQDSLKASTSRKLEDAEIQWVNQWPAIPVKDQVKKDKLSFSEIVLGKKKQLLNRPVSIAAANQESFWVLDQENKTVLQVKNGDDKMPNYIEKHNFNFSSLVSICSFHNNEYLFTDSYLNKIFKIDPEKKECTVLNDSLKLDKPTGIFYSSLKNEIWVLETGAHRIIILNDKGQIIKKIGSRGTAKGEFNFPTHIWIDSKGNAYIVDAMNFRVQVFNKDGEVISCFGSNGDATGYFASPKGIAADSYGHIYVADALFNAVQVFDIDGTFLYTFGTQGHEIGQFWMPSGLYIDKENKIYVADSYNSRIQVFQLIAGGKK